MSPIELAKLQDMLLAAKRMIEFIRQEDYDRLWKTSLQ